MSRFLHRHRLVRSPLSLALGLSLIAAAQAQEAPSGPGAVQLDRLTVTAQKREQQVADVPIAISAYSGELLRTLGIGHIDELSAYVPGFHAQLQSPNNPGYVVRGITSDTGQSNQNSRVSIYQDGVDISRARGSVVAMHDLERIEVLRGPQGTLFGRGAESGAVSLIQNKARIGSDESGFDAEIGNYDSRRLSGYLNLPVNDDVAARIAVHHAYNEGMVKNLGGGRLNGEDTSAVRASLRFELEDGGIDVIANWQHDTPPGTDFHNDRQPNRNGSTDVFGDSDLNRGGELGLDRTVSGLTVLGDFSLGENWRLSTVTGLRKFDSTEQFDADGGNQYLLEMAEYAEGRQFSQELRFNYDAGGRVRAFTGLNGFRETGEQRVSMASDERQFFKTLIVDNLSYFFPAGYVPGALLGGSGYIPVAVAQAQLNTVMAAYPGLNPVYLAAGVPMPFNTDFEEGYVNRGKTRALEAFGDVTFDATERLQLTAGLRLSRETLEAGYRTIDAVTPGTLGLIGLGTGFVPVANNNLFKSTGGQWISGEDSFTSVVGRLVANYRLDNANLYASLSRGRKPDVIQPTADGVETLPAEIVLSGEVGIKGDAAGGRFLYDLAAFYYDYGNFQSSVYENAQYLTRNAGRAHAPGIEASLQHNVSRNVAVLFNYTWMRARFNAVDKDANPQALAGNRMRMTPDSSASLAVLLSKPFGNGHRFYFRPNYRWMGDMYFDDENAAGTAQDAYGTFNLRTGVSLSGGRWDIGLWANNLTDEEYLIDAGNTGAVFGYPTFIRGAPRTFGLSVSGRF